MATIDYNKDITDWVISRQVIYPPGCLASYQDLDFNLKLVDHGRRYQVDHRPYPGKENLTQNLTSRELVYANRSVWAPQYHDIQSACPHSGVHGTVHDLRYYSTVLHSGQITSTTSFENQKSWADALRRKLSSNRVNLSSSVAEYRESAKLFVSLAKGLFGAYRDIRRGRWPEFGNARIQDIPASILAYNFGIAPLVGDVFSVIEALRLKLAAPISMRCSASVKKPIEDVVKIGANEFIVKGSIRQRATIYYEMDPTQFKSEYFDFGNPIEWAWELIPFSFVVDWAIPIGGYLNGLDALNGIVTNSIRGTVTTKLDEKWHGRWSEAEVAIRPFTGSFKSYKREGILNTIPAPLPRWKPSLSWKRVLNASSILAQMSLNHLPKIKFLR